MQLTQVEIRGLCRTQIFTDLTVHEKMDSTHYSQQIISVVF